MEDIKLTSTFVLRKEYNGYGIYIQHDGFSSEIFFASFESLETEKELRKYFIEELMFYSTPENSLALNEIIGKYYDFEDDTQ